MERGGPPRDPSILADLVQRLRGFTFPGTSPGPQPGDGPRNGDSSAGRITPGRCSGLVRTGTVPVPPHHGASDHQNQHTETQQIGVVGLQIDRPIVPRVDLKQPVGLNTTLIQNTEDDSRDGSEDQRKRRKRHKGTVQRSGLLEHDRTRRRKSEEGRRRREAESHHPCWSDGAQPELTHKHQCTLVRAARRLRT